MVNTKQSGESPKSCRSFIRVSWLIAGVRLTPL